MIMESGFMYFGIEDRINDTVNGVSKSELLESITDFLKVENEKESNE